MAEATNYTGGETQPAAFSVSHAELGVSISMADYTYGGTVPTPALAPETSGLSVTWKYAGADGVEKPWQDITGTTLGAGSYTIIAEIAQSTLYEEARLTASFTVKKATPSEIVWPTAGGIAYGQTLAESALTSTDANGTFAWKDATVAPDAGMHSYAVVYTPKDADNYDYTGVALEAQVEIEVAKAAAPAIVWPESATPITYGQTLADSKLESADANGTFAWKDAAIAPDAGKHLFPFTYIPGDAQNYDYTGVALECEMEVTVQPKDLAGGSVTVAPIPDQTHTGKAITPALTVRDGETALVAGTDYTVAYANNVNAGTATVTITGMGNYAGTLEASFKIIAQAKEEEKDDAEPTVAAPTAAERAEAAQQAAEALAAGEAVSGTMIDRRGVAKEYAVSTVEETGEQGEVLRRTLEFAAEPEKDADGEAMLDESGQPVYTQRNLLLDSYLLEALVERGYTHIRFTVKEASLEWAIAAMECDGNVIRLAPMEPDELSDAEESALEAAAPLSGSYRARITAVIDGKETDVTADIHGLTACFAAEPTEAPAQTQCLLVPGDGEPETAVSEAQYAEEGEAEAPRAFHKAELSESGLFILIQP